MKKMESSEVTNIIAVSLCFGIPIIACAVFSLKMFIEYGDWFLSGMLFLLSSLICGMIVNAFSPVIFILMFTLNGLWWLAKKTFSGIRHLINRHSRNSA